MEASYGNTKDSVDGGGKLGLKILKFDMAHPSRYLRDKMESNKDTILKMDRRELLDWILRLRCNYSDYITAPMAERGWSTEEYILDCPEYRDKVWMELYGKENEPPFLKACRIAKDFFFPPYKPNDAAAAEHYARKKAPDVIFVREWSEIPSATWQPFRKHALLVCMIASPMPHDWHPKHWDLIFTSLPAYKDFFEAHGVESIVVPNGFDTRVLEEIGEKSRDLELTFVGTVGPGFQTRNSLLEKIASHDEINFKWWGNGWPNETEALLNYPWLRLTWQGLTGGMEMYEIYGRSKIVVNDYIDIAKGKAVNQRIYEIMGMGALMLARESESLKERFPAGSYATFSNTADFFEKYQYYIHNDEERIKIAKCGQDFVLSNYNHLMLSKEIFEAISQSFERKFPKVSPLNKRVRKE